MIATMRPLSGKLFKSLSLACLLVALAACSTSEKIKPVDLGPSASVLTMKSAWTSQIGPVNFSLQAHVLGATVTVAASDGTVAALDVASGRDLWRVQVGAPIIAGVGSDGKIAAVVNRENEVVAVQDGRVLWRQRLSSTSSRRLADGSLAVEFTRSTT